MTYSEEEYNALLAVCRSYKNDYDDAFERLKSQRQEIERLRTTLGQCNTELNSALESLKSQCREIGELRAENARLTEKLTQVLLAVDTVKEMNTMCKIDEQRKRAVQDFAEKLWNKIKDNGIDYKIGLRALGEEIDELLKEYEDDTL